MKRYGIMHYETEQSFVKEYTALSRIKALQEAEKMYARKIGPKPVLIIVTEKS